MKYPITFGYFITNPGDVPLANVTVVDDNATPGDTSDDFTMTLAGITNPPPNFVAGSYMASGDDNPADGLLEPLQAETFLFQLTVTATGGGGGGLPVPTGLMDDFLLIGTTSNDIAKAVNVQNGDLGADIVVLSTEINDNVDFDLDDVFLHNAGGVWVDVDNTHSADPANIGPDFLPGAAQVGEGVTWTGDVALTSPNAKFDMSNVELYGQVGVVADSSNPVSSVSNSEFFPDGVGDGFDTTGDGQPLPPNGVTANADAQMAALRAELDAFEDFVTGLAPEVTLSPGAGLPTQEGIEDVDVFELNVDPFDTNGDGIAVIDILVDGGNSDFKITNSNWIIESEIGTFAIFRILGDSNLVLNQSTIVVGDGIDGNGGDPNAGVGGPVSELGAIFIKANDYNDGMGGENAGEALDSGDTVFSFNDTVLNGVGFYDLIVFDEQNNDPNFDNGTTELKINNGQGCSHFISPKINFNNVRFDRCAPPEGGDEEQTNTAEATGTALGETVTDFDSQTIIVSAATTGSTNSAPLAANDSFSVSENGVLTTNGVLDNDSDPDGDALVAVLVEGPVNGTLDLADDGSFTYIPAAGYFGTDSFSYLASDGTAGSNVATVTIEVTTSQAASKRFYVVDTGSDASFIYNAEGSSVTDFDLGNGNTAPRGAAANVAGDTLWVIDNDDHVYVYDGAGSLQSSWRARGLDRPEGIATDEVHIWIVDRGLDEVLYYENAAAVTGGSVSATSSFALASGNRNPRGITTDGTYLWVVNDAGNADRVFKYTISGSFVGSWTIDGQNARPRGITIDPSNPDHIWIVDDGSDQVFKYSGAVGRTSGSQSADAVFDLLSGNSRPEGIADPPTETDAAIESRNDAGHARTFIILPSGRSSAQRDEAAVRTDAAQRLLLVENARAHSAGSKGSALSRPGDALWTDSLSFHRADSDAADAIPADLLDAAFGDLRGALLEELSAL